MTEEEALAGIRAADPDRRMVAARALARGHSEAGVPQILAALKSETDPWVRRVLQAALSRSEVFQRWKSGVTLTPESDDFMIEDAVRTEVVEEVTERLLHEIRPILGAIRLHAAKEIANDYDGSRTRTEVDRLDSLLQAFQRLNRAASARRREEFDLAAIVNDLANAVASNSNVNIDLVGESPVVVTGDKALSEMVIANALRNAADSTLLVDESDRKPIIINWGETDRDYWLAVLDSGVGLPVGLDKLFDIGTTTKKRGDHWGMGLAIAKQATASLGGAITLKPREAGGASFELRWPRTRIEEHETSAH